MAFSFCFKVFFVETNLEFRHKVNSEFFQRYMNKKSFQAQISFLLVVFLMLAQLAQARPQFNFPIFQDTKQKKKLPLINYVRSHDFDQKHIALNLRFDDFRTTEITVS